MFGLPSIATVMLQHRDGRNAPQMVIRRRYAVRSGFSESEADKIANQKLDDSAFDEYAKAIKPISKVIANKNVARPRC